MNFGSNLDKTYHLYVDTVIKRDFSFVIFVSAKVIRLINKFIPPDERYYLMDGTFKIVPRKFYQLLIISIEYKNDVSIKKNILLRMWAVIFYR